MLSFKSNMTFRLIRVVLGQYLKKRTLKMLPPKTLFPQTMTVRSANMLPRSQYDNVLPYKFKFPDVFRTNWEIIPLFTVTGLAMGFVVAAVIWALMHKVDVVHTTHNRQNISHTMDLRSPSVHKMILIRQKYKPWPQMQDSLDKMKEAECNRYLNAAEMN